MKFSENSLRGTRRFIVMLALWLGCMMTAVGTASAQTSNGGTVNGTVVDEAEHLPMPGVTVAVMKGGKMVTGTSTNLDGEFTVKVPAGAKLKFSYIGYAPQELAPVFNKSMDIVLKEDAETMDEVVVNGYFTRKKNTYTGAAKTISGDELLSVSPTNILQAISTLDAGLNITQNNAMGSNPNNIPDLVIRSTTSLATSNEVGLNSPLIVIDGVESSLQALYDMNIQDIERVDILKDASATALYGENAANGVIIIERKRVTQAPVRVRYNFTPQFSFADLSSYDLCNAAQKLELERLSGLYKSPSGALDQSYYDKLAIVNSGTDIDWISKPVRNSFSHTHSLSVSGRGSSLDYNFTANYSDVNGVMKEDGRSRYGFDIYLSYRVRDKLVVTLRADHTSLQTNNSPYGSFSEYIAANPYESPYDSHGNYRKELSYSRNNPLYEASLSSFSKSNTRTQNLSLDVRYNFKPNLYITAQGAYSTSTGKSDVFRSPESNYFSASTALNQRGSYTLGNMGADNWSGKIIGNWIHNFDKEGTMFTLNLGWEVKRDKSTSSYLTGSGFLSDDLNDIAYATTYSIQELPRGGEDLSTSVGGFAAANFIFKNRYVVDGSYRLSGSSKFGADNRTAPFWSVGLGYNLHNESFMRDLGFVDLLRVRGSYGYTGSVKFSSYQAVSTYFYSINYLHYAGVGAIPMGIANPDLTWQTTKKFNIGLTSSLIKDRVNINFDYYRETTDDMLIDVSLPPSSGATSVKNNFGKQKSNGIEFSLWGKIIQTRDWGWNLSVNGLHSKTTILNISDALKRKNEENAEANNETAPRLQFREGYSPTTIYAVRSAGIDPASGKEIFIKKDGTYTYEYDALDQVACGDTNPKLQGTFSSLLTWKNLSLNLNFSYRVGGKLYNSTRMAKVENINPRGNVDIRAFTERWKQPGDRVPYLAINLLDDDKDIVTYAYSDRFVEKDNELWLSSLMLQYNFPQKMIQPIGLQRLYLSAGAEDLFRLTSAKYERGTSYPYSRSLNFSLSVTF
ncbi:MAG: SusC/RagA family TonB-linked outer membrane protein [Duncaniella sp.]|uniref:SusC/RagA family TonB-linked outer membrane protein n=1 Tax=Duncaniella sp. TaxID=2518496 RepID=UPI0023C88365|nr:SusC/RagA family TonB-linked outer membrane protein [Duncaniella sp.]MDE6090073.1 SusC/RagA family TonB-linked outer membrane protein [Duncaniella sp.]